MGLSLRVDRRLDLLLSHFVVVFFAVTLRRLKLLEIDFNVVRDPFILKYVGKQDMQQQTKVKVLTNSENPRFHDSTE